MHDGEWLTIHEAQRNPPLFTVILSVIHAGQEIAFENQRCIENIDAALSDDRTALVFVPFEVHAADLPIEPLIVRNPTPAGTRHEQ